MPVRIAALLSILLLASACGGKTDSSGQSDCGKQGETCCQSDVCKVGLHCGTPKLCVVDEPLGTGQDCLTDGDCKAGHCEPLGARQVCLSSCLASAKCDVTGWSCDIANQRCTCEAKAETCNGIDDDCNGVVDDAAAANADCTAKVTGSSCVAGNCSCPVAQCGSSCVDTQTDPAHCGACDNACATGEICVEGACDKPSCTKALKCNGESCCTSLPVPGGTFPMGRSLSGSDAYPTALYQDDLPEHDVTVSSYSLDKYEVTVGRMRAFVEAYDEWRESGHPKVGEGPHPLIAGSGWQAGWVLPQNALALQSSLKCSWATQTWTDAPDKRENQPVECVSWPVAFAFCLWDAGRLPAEAEWEYAAAGGDYNRLFPWGSSGKESSKCPTNAVCQCTANQDQCVADDYLAVGSKTEGNGRYGQADLAGNVSEWVLDGYSSDWYSAGGATCHDCANLDWSVGNVTRGGAISSGAEDMRSARRFGYLISYGPGYAGIGIRCARALKP